jgi:hypothetical protein
VLKLWILCFKNTFNKSPQSFKHGKKMKRTKAIHIRDILNDFYRENPQIKQKILEIRIRRAWGEILGPIIMRSTQNLYVKNQVMYVFLNSSVLRSELILNRKHLLKSLNDYTGSEVIRDIVIR